MQSGIEQVRRFNRTVSRRIGVLRDRFLGLGRPVGESRLLFEIGTEGSEVRALRGKLGLDSGYVSRLLRSLEAQGLTLTQPAPCDARMRYVRLTAKGLREREKLDRRSIELAQSLLAPLGDKQRELLVTAMRQVEQLLTASEVTIAAEPPSSRAARWCLENYFGELDARFEGGYDPAAAAAVADEELAPPDGVFLVARSRGEPVGCGTLRRCGPETGEIKRLWVAPSARGLGLGERLLLRLEAHARQFAMTAVRLDTNRSLKEAQALYRKHGYREVAPFNDDPYPDHWFEKRLG